jgi:hypothetical protein
MAISLSSVTRTSRPKPDRIVYYATHGLGKTSLAAGAPNPIFIQTEDGLGALDAPTFGLMRSYSDVMEAIGELYTQEHEFQTVAIDSADWLEPMVWSEACRMNGWESIETPGYGRGYAAALDVWRSVLDGLNALRDERNMTVITLAHAEIRKIEPPDSDSYDRYQPKLHKGASALIQENADSIFFGQYRLSLIKENPKDKNSRSRAVGGGQRVIYTTERPSHLAKNRWRMPDQISLPDNPEPSALWDTVAQHIPYYNQNQT